MEIPQLAAHLTGAAILDGPGGLLLGGTLAHHAYTPPSCSMLHGLHWPLDGSTPSQLVSGATTRAV